MNLKNIEDVAKWSKSSWGLVISCPAWWRWACSDSPACLATYKASCIAASSSRILFYHEKRMVLRESHETLHVITPYEHNDWCLHKWAPQFAFPKLLFKHQWVSRAVLSHQVRYYSRYIQIHLMDNRFERKQDSRNWLWYPLSLWTCFAGYSYTLPSFDTATRLVTVAFNVHIRPINLNWRPQRYPRQGTGPKATRPGASSEKRSTWELKWRRKIYHEHFCQRRD